MRRKYTWNSFHGFNNNIHGDTIALRISRVNHLCKPNASPIFDETARVAILFAEKDIQPGEEISFCYYFFFFSLIPDMPCPGTGAGCTIQEEVNCFKTCSLYSVRDITCPTDCLCYDSATLALVQEGRQLFKTTIHLYRLLKTEEALAAGEKLLDIHRRLNLSMVYRALTEYLLFQIAVMKSETLPRAKEYIRSAVELFRKICPFSESQTKKYEKLLEFPESHPNYKKIDKMTSDVERFLDQLSLL